MFVRLALAAAIAVTTAIPAHAEMVERMSPHSVADTMDRLESAVKDAGATVFARVDHAEGAANVEMTLAPTELLIFGNPELGTPAMLDSRTAGLDLPMRVLAYEDDAGAVHVVYETPATLADTHGLPSDADYLQKMTGALDKLTAKAIAAD